MAWQCKLVDREEIRARGEQPQPGDMWYADWYLHEDGSPVSFLSPEYKRDWLGKRPPIAIQLPCGDAWVIDMCFGSDPKNHGWTITGEVPNLTASPSINAVGSYHGWLQNGVLTDDIEGRTY